MAVAAKVQTGKFSAYARLLQSKRDELRARLTEHHREFQADHGHDDDWGVASRNLIQELAISTLEREQQTLGEVEAALERLEKGEFGICENCGDEVSERRLRALPWARYCLRCAEKLRVGQAA